MLMEKMFLRVIDGEKIEYNPPIGASRIELYKNNVLYNTYPAKYYFNRISLTNTVYGSARYDIPSYENFSERMWLYFYVFDELGNKLNNKNVGIYGRIGSTIKKTFLESVFVNRVVITPNDLNDIDNIYFYVDNPNNNNLYLYLGLVPQWSITDTILDSGEYYMKSISSYSSLWQDNNSNTVTINLDDFIINFYNNTSEQNRLNKNEYLSNTLSLNGKLRDSSNIVNPYIEIEYGNVFNYNYCRIPKFGRWYYITDIVCIRNNLWGIQLSVDVLMSFKEQIQELDCSVVRNEFTFNKLLPDDEYPALPEQEVKILEPFVTWDSDFFFPTLDGGDDYYYVVTMAFRPLADQIPNPDGGNYYYASYRGLTQSIYGNSPVICNRSMLISIIFTIMNDTFWAGENFLSGLKKFFTNPDEFFSSIMCFPISVKSIMNDNITKIVNSNGENGIWIGNDFFTETIEYPNWTTPVKVRFNEPMYQLSFNDGRNDENVKNLRNIGRVLVARYTQNEIKPQDFTDYSSYCYAEIFLPFYGYISLDIDVLYNYFLVEIYYNIDINNGNCVVTIEGKKIANDDAKVLYTFNFSIGFEIPITRTNANDIARNVLLQGLNLAGSVVGLSFNHTPSKITETTKFNRSKKTGQVTSFSKNKQIEKGEREFNTEKLPNVITNSSVGILSSMQKHIDGGTVNSDMSSFVLSNKNRNSFIKLTKTKLKPLTVEEERKYNHFVGRPIQYFGKLKELSGYTEVGAVHMDGFSTATDSELDMIESALKSGVIL